ncbi:restriction endonuclease [Alteromonas sp. 1_MG-2023]|uniref:restriction endonuclease n=1 Tax=Alteromonas sp. 1_MG-2023 TaxID=3062669 RepID=UPI0026E1D7E3|nr:restriction endonuclease [Alteromonas sp. 1_MG-2023]MDO6569091.1 restriction endonuclease [Alteromonas sp. 1_MG-2023]
MEIEKFIKQLDKLSRTYFYEPSYREDRIVLCRKETLLTVPIEFSEKEVAIYLYARTTSWDADGDRTDMNDIFSTLPALFLRVNDINISCTLLDLEHPLGQGDDGAIRPVELYARYITINQPLNNGLLARTKESLKFIDKFLDVVTQYEVSLYHFIESSEKLEAKCVYQDLNLHIWAMTLVKALKEDTNSDSVLYNMRVNPSWYYFRSKKEKISVLFSPKTAFMLNEIASNKKGLGRHETDGFNFYKSEDTLNSFTDIDKSKIINVLEALGESITSVTFVPIENRLIAIAKEHIISLECECDKRIYSQGKSTVIQRRKIEKEFLFEGRIYKWAPKIDGGRFEELSRELLIRKQGVIKVSNTSVTNEPDANADLICIWDSTALSDMPQDERTGLLQRRKVVVQCKAWSKNIGKNDIPSIRDTLDRFEADGMLIISSKSIARSLFDHIEVLRRKGIWADYWDRSEIESMLDDNPDLVSKYQDIVCFDENA